MEDNQISYGCVNNFLAAHVYTAIYSVERLLRHYAYDLALYLLLFVI